MTCQRPARTRARTALAGTPTDAAWPTVITPSWAFSSRRHSGGNSLGMTLAFGEARGPGLALLPSVDNLTVLAQGVDNAAALSRLPAILSGCKLHATAAFRALG